MNIYIICTGWGLSGYGVQTKIKDLSYALESQYPNAKIKIIYHEDYTENFKTVFNLEQLSDNAASVINNSTIELIPNQYYKNNIDLFPVGDFGFLFSHEDYNDLCHYYRINHLIKLGTKPVIENFTLNSHYGPEELIDLNEPHILPIEHLSLDSLEESANHSLLETQKFKNLNFIDKIELKNLQLIYGLHEKFNFESSDIISTLVKATRQYYQQELKANNQNIHLLVNKFSADTITSLKENLSETAHFYDINDEQLKSKILTSDLRMPIVIYVGSLPSKTFNYLLANSNIPPLCEGHATFGFLASIGKIPLMLPDKNGQGEFPLKSPFRVPTTFLMDRLPLANLASTKKQKLKNYFIKLTDAIKNGDPDKIVKFYELINNNSSSINIFWQEVHQFFNNEKYSLINNLFLHIEKYQEKYQHNKSSLDDYLQLTSLIDQENLEGFTSLIQGKNPFVSPSAGYMPIAEYIRVNVNTEHKKKALLQVCLSVVKEHYYLGYEPLSKEYRIYETPQKSLHEWSKIYLNPTTKGIDYHKALIVFHTKHFAELYSTKNLVTNNFYHRYEIFNFIISLNDINAFKIFSASCKENSNINELSTYLNVLFGINANPIFTNTFLQVMKDTKHKVNINKYLSQHLVEGFPFVSVANFKVAIEYLDQKNIVAPYNSVIKDFIDHRKKMLQQPGFVLLPELKMALQGSPVEKAIAVAESFKQEYWPALKEKLHAIFPEAKEQINFYLTVATREQNTIITPDDMIQETQENAHHLSANLLSNNTQNISFFQSSNTTFTTKASLAAVSTVSANLSAATLTFFDEANNMPESKFIEPQFQLDWRIGLAAIAVSGLIIYALLKFLINSFDHQIEPDHQSPNRPK